MNNQQSITALCLLTLAASQTLAETDLIVSDITSATTFGSVDDKIAYSFGTTICNIGDSEAAWIDGTNQNPLISQTLYRLADGQIQQLGIGFAHYATPPLSANACGLGCTPAGFNALGPGCSTTSSAAIHGLQATLGPRTEIDPYTGDYPYPFTSIGQTGDAIYKRLQVNIADISDADALYFVETQIITSAETTPQTRANNVSYRQVTFAPGSATATVVGPTYTEQPAIFAWRDHGNGIGMPDASVMITQATIQDDGIFHLASKVTDLGTGGFRYDYAVHNQNTLDAVNTLQIPGAGMHDSVDNMTFHNVNYHDDVDELIEDSDFTSSGSSINAYWRQYDFAGDLTNVIRWGTTYSFSFEVDNAPRTHSAVVQICDMSNPFNSTTPMLLDAQIPTFGDVCQADVTGTGTITFHDVSVFVSSFAFQDPSADFVPDGEYNFFDVSAFLNAFAAGCP